MAKQELLATIRDRYRECSKKDKSRILDEFIAVTGHHRKQGIRLVAQSEDGIELVGAVRGRRIYDECSDPGLGDVRPHLREASRQCLPKLKPRMCI